MSTKRDNAERIAEIDRIKNLKLICKDEISKYKAENNADMVEILNLAFAGLKRKLFQIEKLS